MGFGAPRSIADHRRYSLKNITQRVSALMYKFILLILDYAEFLVESAPAKEICLLDQLQNRDIRLILHYGVQRYLEDGTVEDIYNIIPLKER